MAETTCPTCGRRAEGRFCSWCGAALGARRCTECEAELEPGARFCNRCGSPLAQGGGGAAGARGGRAGRAAGGAGGGASADGDGSPLAWWVAGGAMVVLILIVAYPVIRQDDVARTGTMAPAAGGSPADVSRPGQGASSVDLASMTPREAADSLFHRVMRAASAGDSAQVVGFLPMSIQAYERARPLDADGLFHLALLQQTGGDLGGALATARGALEDHPNHLLNLGVAAQAAHLMGDEDVARGYYQRLLDVWDEEMDRDLPEYQDHSRMLPGLRQEARDFLAR